MNRDLLSRWTSDLFAAVSVCCVAIPMCLGIASLSGADPVAGILAGIVGGVIVGMLSNSQTSITGPSAGLTMIVAGQLALLGSYESFLLAVVYAGVFQIAFGTLRVGWLAYFFPSSVLQALLSAIGTILILKQIPHLLGHDADPEGDMSFLQPDRQTTLSELATVFYGDVHLGAMVVGFISLGLLIAWRNWPRLKNSPVPGTVVAIAVGVLLTWAFRRMGGNWEIEGKHLVQVPIVEGKSLLEWSIRYPDWSRWLDGQVILAALVIAAASSLETLLNVSATDRHDAERRHTSPTRELFALGAGNLAVGLIGGIPMSSAIERSAVNLEAKSSSKWSTVIHGSLLGLVVFFLPSVVELIPLSALAAVLIVTGYRLLNPEKFVEVWRDGRYQFIPFLVTYVAMVLTNLMIGVLVGLGVGIAFVLNSNFRRPLRRVLEKHVGGDLLKIELGNQLSFLNRPALESALREAPTGATILLDARNTDYIDPDILAMIRDYKRQACKKQGTQLVLKGFRDRYALEDDIQFVDYTSRELQEQLTPDDVLRLLREGNERFCTGRRLSRDLGRQVQATSSGQHPFAAVLGCIDSRAPAETLLDVGLGDVFSVRVAGNVTSPKVLGSLEYATAVVGSKLILVLGHTKCGAVNAAVKLSASEVSIEQATGCQHLESILEEIQPSIDQSAFRKLDQTSPVEESEFIEEVARQNVIRSVQKIAQQSRTIGRLVDEGKVAIVGAIYDVNSGRIDFMTEHALGLEPIRAQATKS